VNVVNTNSSVCKLIDCTTYSSAIGLSLLNTTSYLQELVTSTFLIKVSGHDFFVENVLKTCCERDRFATGSGQVCLMECSHNGTLCLFCLT